jgi:hypothetical protein
MAQGQGNDDFPASARGFVTKKFVIDGAGRKIPGHRN